jgi:hypothetical protein
LPGDKTVNFAKKHTGLFTLIWPAATFSLMEKESRGRAWPSSLSQRERVGERENAWQYNRHEANA